MRSFIVFLCLVPTLLFARQTQLETQLKEAIKGKKAEIGIAVIIDAVSYTHLEKLRCFLLSIRQFLHYL